MLKTMASTDVTVVVDLPFGAIPGANADLRTVGLELRRLWLIEQVRSHRIGVGKAAELADMARAAFMALLGAHGVAAIDYAVDDLMRELEGPAAR